MNILSRKNNLGERSKVKGQSLLSPFTLHLSPLLLALLFIVFLTSPTNAGDISATLDSTDGTSKFVVKDSGLTLLQNKAGCQDESRQPVRENLLKNFFNASVAAFACGFDGRNKTKNQRWRLLLNRRLWLPLFSSFIFCNYNTDHKKCNSYDEESNAQNKRHLFKKIASNPDRYNRLAQISQIFGDKFLRFFVEDNTHDEMVSLLKNVRI